MTMPTAPYNFVPLNDKVVPAECVPGTGGLCFDRYQEGRKSGYIDINIKTKTPLFVRHTSGKSDFFSPGGIFKIPGSSLLGMVRNLVEIVSYGRFSICDEHKKLYFRSFDGRTLGTTYATNTVSSALVGGNMWYFPMARAGFLRKQGNEYRVYPAQYYRVNGVFANGNFTINGTTISCKPFSFKSIYFIPVNYDRHPHHGHELYYAKVEKVSDVQTPGYEKGYLVATGAFGAKKHMQWIVREIPSTEYMVLGEKVLDEYQNDSNRKDNINLIELLKKDPTGVPCFYIPELGIGGSLKAKAFGHTGFFRLPYTNTIGKHINQKMINKDLPDIPEAMFGIEGQWAGRLFFEDSDLVSKEESALLPETALQILSAPKETTFQHYLEPDSHGRVQHWDGNTKIRGYKLYWHKDINNHPEHWKASAKDLISEGLVKFLNGKNCFEQNSVNRIRGWESTKYYEDIVRDDAIPPRFKELLKEYLLTDKKSQHTLVQPIKTDNSLNGRIRFENLSDVELGALLFVLNLPEEEGGANCCHKLGMGKPLGLGSVKITPILHLTDRKKRYTTVFNSEGCWNLATERQKNAMIYIKAFGDYVLSYVAPQDPLEKGKGNGFQALKVMIQPNLWDIDGLKSLKILLDWNNTTKTDWLEITRYKRISPTNEFIPPHSERTLLKTPQEIVANVAANH